jgi:hypothetical protein
MEGFGRSVRHRCSGVPGLKDAARLGAWFGMHQAGQELCGQALTELAIARTDLDDKARFGQVVVERIRDEGAEEARIGFALGAYGRELSERSTLEPAGIALRTRWLSGHEMSPLWQTNVVRAHGSRVPRARGILDGVPADSANQVPLTPDEEAAVRNRNPLRRGEADLET